MNFDDLVGGAHGGRTDKRFQFRGGGERENGFVEREPPYNTGMAAKTVYVYPSDGTWAVKRDGKSGKVYTTRTEAIDAARKSVKSASSGQFVVYGEDGQITEHRTYKLAPLQDAPKKSSRADEIARAVGKVTLRRLQSETSSEHSPQK